MMFTLTLPVTVILGQPIPLANDPLFYTVSVTPSTNPQDNVQASAALQNVGAMIAGSEASNDGGVPVI